MNSTECTISVKASNFLGFFVQILSSYIFIMMEEVLSEMINKEVAQKHILPSSLSSGAPIVSHLLFTDVVNCFWYAKDLFIVRWMFSQSTNVGQGKVNHEKFAMFLSKHISSRRENEFFFSQTDFIEGKF